MIIDISQVLKGEGESLDFDGEVLIENFSFGGNSIEFSKPVSVSGRFKNLGDVIFLKGKAKASLNAVCGRCLRNFPKIIEFSLEHKFSKQPDSDEISEFFGNEIFIDDVLCRELCINLPISFLCSEDCKGLCPICGKDLNEGKCSCETDEIDPRMAVLKNFLK